MSITVDNRTDVSSLALEATLTAMKGAGWTNESLKAIKDAVDAMVPGPTAAAIWSFITRRLTNLDDVRAARIDNLDALISSRSSHAPNDVRDAILDDATRFSGTDIDAPISSRSTLTQAQILSDATPFPGANIDAPISSRSSHSAADVWAVVARSLTDKAGFSLSAAGINAIRQSTCLTGDPANSIGKALYELYVNRLTAARAGYLDNINQAGLLQLTVARAGYLDRLDATVSSRLAAASYMTERGTDGAALAVNYTAARATKLDNLDAAISSRSSHSAADARSESRGHRVANTLAGYVSLIPSSGCTLEMMERSWSGVKLQIKDRAGTWVDHPDNTATVDTPENVGPITGDGANVRIYNTGAGNNSYMIYYRDVA